MKIKKSEIDIDKQLVEITFFMKGKGEINVATTINECMKFTDYLNERGVDKQNEYKIRDGVLGDKFYILEDYNTKSTVSINVRDIKAFSVPWFLQGEDSKDEYDVKIMKFR